MQIRLLISYQPQVIKQILFSSQDFSKSLNVQKQSKRYVFCHLLQMKGMTKHSRAQSAR